MSNSSDPPRIDARAEAQVGDGSWLAEVARSACRDVGGVPVELLGDYLPLLADAATSGRRPHPAELDAVGLLGRRAAELGVSAGVVVSLGQAGDGLVDHVEYGGGGHPDGFAVAGSDDHGQLLP